MLLLQEKQIWSKASSILLWLGQEQLTVVFYPEHSNYIHHELSTHQQDTVMPDEHPGAVTGALSQLESRV